MIAQERLEQALKFLSETDEQHAKLTAGVDYLKDLSKNMKGKLPYNMQGVYGSVNMETLPSKMDVEIHLDIGENSNSTLISKLNHRCMENFRSI